MSPEDVLKNYFDRRHQKNQAYSLRSFARDIRLSPATVSQIFSKKRRISRSAARTISERLSLEVPERYVLAMRAAGLDDKQAEEARHILDCGKQSQPDITLNTDTFHLIAEPHHYALLSLIRTKGFREDYDWIAKRLSVSIEKARSALERLSVLGLIERKDNGAIVCRAPRLTSTNDIPAEGLRQHHLAKLNQAIASLNRDPIDKRDISSVTFATNVKRIEAAKQMVRDFRRGLVEVLESDDSTEVYTLSIQLFPVSQEVSNEST